MGERDVELVAALLLGDLKPAEDHPAAIGRGAQALGLEPVLLEERVHVAPPLLEAARALVDLAVYEDGLHADLKVGMQQGGQPLPATVELVVDPPYGVECRAGVRFLHCRVELTLERLDVVLVVHLMVLSISPVVRMTRHRRSGKLSERSWRQRSARGRGDRRRGPATLPNRKSRPVSPRSRSASGSPSWSASAAPCTRSAPGTARTAS